MSMRVLAEQQSCSHGLSQVDWSTYIVVLVVLAVFLFVWFRLPTRTTLVGSEEHGGEQVAVHAVDMVMVVVMGDCRAAAFRLCGAP